VRERRKGKRGKRKKTECEMRMETVENDRRVGGDNEGEEKTSNAPFNHLMYPSNPHSSANSFPTRACENPEAACVDDSLARSSRSAKRALQVVQPRREPGQMVSARRRGKRRKKEKGSKVSNGRGRGRRKQNILEKVSIRTTRP
jgi:hypothetical protein